MFAEDGFFLKEGAGLHGVSMVFASGGRSPFPKAAGRPWQTIPVMGTCPTYPEPSHPHRPRPLAAQGSLAVPWQKLGTGKSVHKMACIHLQENRRQWLLSDKPPRIAN